MQVKKTSNFETMSITYTAFHCIILQIVLSLIVQVNKQKPLFPNINIHQQQTWNNSDVPAFGPGSSKCVLFTARTVEPLDKPHDARDVLSRNKWPQ